MEITWVNSILLIVALTVPALAALCGSYLVLRNTQQQIELRTRSEMRINAFANFVQLRIAAHERLILYLERMQPESLILRNRPTEHNAAMLEALMLREIQLEFEHNIVQQLYLDSNTWRMIESAKTELLQIIQRSTQAVSNEASGLKLAEQISLEVMGLENGLKLRSAIDALKYDLKESFK